jgi:hypothetical protein
MAVVKASPPTPAAPSPEVTAPPRADSPTDRQLNLSTFPIAMPTSWLATEPTAAPTAAEAASAVPTEVAAANEPTVAPKPVAAPVSAALPRAAPEAPVTPNKLAAAPAV